MGRTLICTGGRTFGEPVDGTDETLRRERNREANHVWTTLEWLAPKKVLVGDCKTGADRLVREWCLRNKVDFEEFKAHWLTEGLSAGPKRNKRMCEAARNITQIMLLAFPGGKGTENCVQQAKRLNYPAIRTSLL